MARPRTARPSIQRPALAVAWLLGFLLPTGLARGADPESPGGRVVREVRLTGQERLDRETILYYINLKPGAAYDPDAARADFRKLWETGFFEDLRLETEEVPDGVDLVWHIVERPVLATLKFSGNEGISTEDIQKHFKEKGIELREGSPFGLGDLDRSRVVLEGQYREKGYRFVKVETELKDDAEGAGKDVTFKVDEGAKVRIATIEFEGNRAFSDGDLRSALKKTKEESFLCFLLRKCVFNEPNFNEDLEKLKDFYYDRGYINFGMGEPAIESEGEGKSRRLHIRISVTELDNPRYLSSLKRGGGA